MLGGFLASLAHSLSFIGEFELHLPGLLHGSIDLELCFRIEFNLHRLIHGGIDLELHFRSDLHLQIEVIRKGRRWCGRREAEPEPLPALRERAAPEASAPAPWARSARGAAAVAPQAAWVGRAARPVPTHRREAGSGGGPGRLREGGYRHREHAAIGFECSRVSHFRFPLECLAGRLRGRNFLVPDVRAQNADLE